MSRRLDASQRRRPLSQTRAEISEARAAPRRERRRVSWRNDFDPGRIGRGVLRHRSTTAGASPHERRPRPSDRAERRLALAVSLPSDGFAFYLTLSSESFSTFPRGTCSLSVSRSVSSLGWGDPPGFGLRSQTTRLSDRRVVSSSRLARDTGPTPSLGRIRSGRVTRARLAAYFAAAGPCATCRRPPSRAAGFGARLCSLFHDRRFASLAVTEKTPVGFFFHRLVICLNSAGSPARPQVSLAGMPSSLPCLSLVLRPQRSSFTLCLARRSPFGSFFSVESL